MAILNTLMLAEETRTLTMNILARPGLQARYNCPMGESKPRDQGQGKQKATYALWVTEETGFGWAGLFAMSGSQFNSLCPADHFAPFAPSRGPGEGQTPGVGVLCPGILTPVTHKQGGGRPKSCSFVVLSQWP